MNPNGWARECFAKVPYDLEAGRTRRNGQYEHSNPYRSTHSNTHGAGPGADAPDMQPNPAMAVSIRGLFKRFGNKVAVNGLSLDIPTGSFYGLVGPNGAGKTTTINMLTGLLVPDGGVAMILGHNVWQDVNAAKRLIGLMPQPEQIFPTLTGMQLVVYAGMLRGMPRAEAAARAKDLIAAFDLTAAANIMVRDYSAGMTKKICLATAMIHSPRILVLDEPSNRSTRCRAQTSKTSSSITCTPAARWSSPRM